MSQEGERIIVSTAYHANFYSEDYGSTWSPLDSDVSCSIMAATYDLDKIVCVGGPSQNKNYIYYSHNGGDSFKKTGSSKAVWAGIVADRNDLSFMVAVENMGYTYNSTDYGTTWDAHTNTEKNDWGCLAASDDSKVILVTDHGTGNAHITFDYGAHWENVYSLYLNKVDSVTITSCAVSTDGTKYAVGFKGQEVLTTTGVDIDNFDRSEQEWKVQEDLPTDVIAMSASFNLAHLYTISSDGTIYAATVYDEEEAE
jgi:photosystem II stability/assembly factor-like uncharacterized protein